MYLKARFTWKDVFGAASEGADSPEAGGRKGWDARVYAKVWAIIGDDNHTDYGRNLGHFELVGAFDGPDYRWGSLAFELVGRMGDDFDRGNLLAGVSYGFPFQTKVRFVPHVYAQYSHGYGETLARADTLTRAFRIGLRFVR